MCKGCQPGKCQFASCSACRTDSGEKCEYRCRTPVALHYCELDLCGHPDDEEAANLLRKEREARGRAQQDRELAQAQISLMAELDQRDRLERARYKASGVA